MEDKELNRLMIAAPCSNSGKTLITCAILEVMRNRGIFPVSFKCGPDFIDPMFHKKVLGIESRNLDTYLAGAEGVMRAVERSAISGYAVIEGVMGLYDGIEVSGVKGSSYEIADILDSPIVLVVDAKGVGRTVISLIKGMLLDDSRHLIKGIILNRMTEGFFNSLKPVLEKELMESGSEVRVLGYFPNCPDISFESRHLGLMLPEEITDIRNRLSKAAEILEKSVDIPELISILESASDGDRSSMPQSQETKSAPTIKDFPYMSQSHTVAKGNNHLTLAVTYDDAFCFYYRDNLDLFEDNGVSICFFSPLHDNSLPITCDGILLGGGYPENYLSELSHNESMRSSIKAAIESGTPSLAECGGFMYLHKYIIGIDGTKHDMAGVIDGECHYTGHLVRFGYMEIASQNEACKSGPLTKSLIGMRGHEFHYYDSTFSGDAYVARKPFGNRIWSCMIIQNNGFWGFPHLYYPSNPAFIKNFIEKMREVKNGSIQ